MLAVDLAKPAVSWADISLRIAVAAALTGAIGMEREIADEGITVEVDLKANANCDLDTALGELAGRKEVTGLDLA